MKLMLRKELGPILGSRDAVCYLGRKIEDVDHVTLDFKEVEFISRSFAHELWMYMESHPEKGSAHKHEQLREEDVEADRATAGHRRTQAERGA